MFNRYPDDGGKKDPFDNGYKQDGALYQYFCISIRNFTVYFIIHPNPFMFDFIFHYSSISLFEKRMLIH